MIKGRNETVAAKIAQRRPELFPQNLYMETEDISNRNFLSPNANLPIPIFKQNEASGLVENHYCIIRNIGLGPAVNLKMEWIYNRHF